MFALQVASFYDAGIQKLVPHYDKCLNTIKQILQNNEYNTSLLEKPLSQSWKQNVHEDQKHQKLKMGYISILWKISKTNN
jgi:hypothetical protein